MIFYVQYLQETPNNGTLKCPSKYLQIAFLLNIALKNSTVRKQCPHLSFSKV